jgi:hypothetical protein
MVLTMMVFNIILLLPTNFRMTTTICVHSYILASVVYIKNEILDSRLLTKEIIKDHAKTRSQTGSVGVQPSDQFAVRALVL